MWQPGDSPRISPSSRILMGSHTRFARHVQAAHFAIFVGNLHRRRRRCCGHPTPFAPTRGPQLPLYPMKFTVRVVEPRFAAYMQAF